MREGGYVDIESKGKALSRFALAVPSKEASSPCVPEKSSPAILRECFAPNTGDKTALPFRASCVCVRERECMRKRECVRDNVCVCVCERERVCACERVYTRECVCVCVRERECT